MKEQYLDFDLISQLFWSKVDRFDDDDCWVWKGNNNKRYGRFIFNGEQFVAHRVMYRMLIGEIPNNECVSQSCRNKLCVNPKHLTIGLPRRSLEDRFWSKVNRKQENECWEWLACKNNKGYGIINTCDINTTNIFAHRLSYELYYGSIPDGLFVLHRCDNPLCVNPSHLFTGTQQDNILDCLTKGRMVHTKKDYCLRGHPFSGENLVIGKLGERRCRTCSRIRDRAYWTRNKLKRQAMKINSKPIAAHFQEIVDSELAKEESR